MYLSSSSHLLQSQGNVAASTHWHHCSSHLLQPQSNDVASIYCGLKAILRLPSVAASRQYCSVRLLQSQGNIATSICCSLKQRCSFLCCSLKASLQRPPVALSKHHHSSLKAISQLASAAFSSNIAVSIYGLKQQGNVAASIYCSLKAILQCPALQSQGNIGVMHLLQSQSNFVPLIYFSLKPQAPLQRPSTAVPRQHHSV